MRTRMMYVAGAAAVALATVAGLASAGALGIATGGTISACYQVANGNLRAVATGTACRGGERALSWSQDGTPRPLAVSTAWRIWSFLRLFSRTWITSPLRA